MSQKAELHFYCVNKTLLKDSKKKVVFIKINNQ